MQIIKDRSWKNYRRTSLRPHINHHQLSHVTLSYALPLAVCILMLPMLVVAIEHMQLAATYRMNPLDQCNHIIHTPLVLPSLNNVLPVMVLQNRGVRPNIGYTSCFSSHFSVQHVFPSLGVRVYSSLGRTVVGVVVVLLLLLCGDIEMNPGPLGQEDLKSLHGELHLVSHKWFSLGIQLQIPIGTLKCIEIENRQMSNCLLEMLTVWLQCTNPPPTWDILTEALVSVGERHLAQQLSDKYCPRSEEWVAPSYPIQEPSPSTAPSSPQEVLLSTTKRSRDSGEEQSTPGVKRRCVHEENSKSLLSGLESELVHGEAVTPTELISYQHQHDNSTSQTPSQLHFPLPQVEHHTFLQHQPPVQPDTHHSPFRAPLWKPTIQKSKFIQPLSYQASHQPPNPPPLQHTTSKTSHEQPHHQISLQSAHMYQPSYQHPSLPPHHSPPFPPQLGNITYQHPGYHHLPTFHSSQLPSFQLANPSSNQTPFNPFHHKSFQALVQPVHSYEPSPQPTRSFPSHPPPPHPDSPLGKYAIYLRAYYTQHHAPWSKWPQLHTRNYINLAVINNVYTTKADLVQFRKQTIHGSIDDILESKAPIEMKDILHPNVQYGTQYPVIQLLIEGAPGIGKSTFAWEVCQKWGQHQLFNEYSLVVLLKFQDKRVQEAKSISDLFYHPNSELQSEIVDYVFATGGHGLLLILEGFNEAPISKRTMDSIFVRLFTGQVLPKATVILTTRPSASAGLRQFCKGKHSRRIEILGFGKKEIDEYIQCAFSDEQSRSDFKEYLSLYPHIRSMMYVPFNSAIVTHVYESCKSSGTVVPKTMTQLYSSLIRTLLLRYLKDKEEYKDTCTHINSFKDLPQPVYDQFCEICKIAYNGVMSPETELIFQDLPSDFDPLGLMQSCPELYVDRGASVSYNFLHLTVQEYLAACHISQQSRDEQVAFIREHSEIENLKVVVECLAGLWESGGKLWNEEFDYLSMCEQVMQKHGTMDQTIIHCIFVGPAGVGKSSLMKRLLDMKLDSKCTSTQLAEKSVQVTKTVAQVSGFGWKVIEDPVTQASELIGQLSTQEMVVTKVDVPNQQISEDVEDQTTHASELLSEQLSPKQEKPFQGNQSTVGSSTEPLSVSDDTASSNPDSQLPPYKSINFLRRVLREKGVSGLRQHVNNPWTLYLTDSGGQPEFQELLPGLVAGPCVFFVVFPLHKDLKRKHEVKYMRPKCTQEYTSSLTVQEDILRSLASIASTKYLDIDGNEVKPKVMLIATFKDKVQLEKDRQKKLKDLEALVKETDAYRQKMILNASETQITFTINNLSDEEEDAKKIRLVVEKVADKFKIHTPFPWLIFNILVQHVYAKDNVISKEECYKLAQECEIHDETDFNAALQFLHKQTGMLHYYMKPPELSQIVIRDPQHLFSRVTELVEKTFVHKNNPYGYSVQNFEKGIFTKKDYMELTKDSSSSKLTPTMLLKLLEHLNVVVPLSDSEKYFMPCAITRINEETDPGRPQSATIPPMLITFKSGYCPKGLFGGLVACIANKQVANCTLNLDESKIHRDQICFTMDQHYLLLRVNPTYIYIELIPNDPDTSLSTFRTPCNGVRELILAKIQTACEKLHYSDNIDCRISFKCPCNQPENFHPAVLRPDMNNCFMCVQSKKVKDVRKECYVWLPQPTIIQHPESRSVAPGTEAVFRVEATGDCLQFQWQKNGSDIHDQNSRYCGTDRDCLHVFMVKKGDKGCYRCKVKNYMNFKGEFSNNAVLTVKTLVEVPRQSSPCSPSEDITARKSLDMKPRMAQLMKLKNAKGEKVEIIKTVEPGWKEFGFLMDLDSNGTTVASIEAEHAHKRKGPATCCQEIFRHWLDKPDATWGNLIELLIDSEHKQLAIQVKDALDL